MSDIQETQSAGGWRCALGAAGAGVLLATALLKPIPLMAGVSTGCILLVAAARARGGCSRALFLNGLLSLVATALCILFLEGAARLLFFETTPSKSHREFHPEYGVALRPNSSADYVVKLENGGRKSVPITISSQGLRDREYGPKAADEFRVVLLGDSFAAGAGVLPEETTERQLENLLAEAGLNKRVVVVNVGTGGFGPWQERGFLREKGFPREPDLVIQQLLMQNDLDDTLRREDRALRAFDRERFGRWLAQRYGNRWQVATDIGLWQKSRLYQVYNQATGEPLLLARALLSLRGTEFSLPRIPTAEARPPYMEHMLKAWYPELDEAFEKMCGDILGVRADCAERGVDFAAYAQPCAQYASPELFDFMLGGQPRENYDPDKDIAPLEAFFAREGIPYAKVGAAVRAHADPKSLYYKLDGHMTPAGHRVVAGCLAEFFLGVYVPGAGAKRGLVLAN